MIFILKPFQQPQFKHWSWVSLCGKDTLDFLHRLTTVNTRLLKVGEGAPGCFLNAQGKILSSFHLWKYAPGEYAFEFDAGQSDHGKTKLFQIIDQYTFSEQQELTDATSQLSCVWMFFDSSEDLSSLHSKLGVSSLLPLQTQALDEEIRVCHHGLLDSGLSWLTLWGRPSRLEQWLERTFPEGTPLSAEGFELLRIQSLLPRIDTEISEEVIPLEVGLRQSIADSKGCYPGQEVIERIISLGSAPRKLALISGSGDLPQPQDPILNLATPPLPIGHITSSIHIPGTDQFLALGLVKKIHAKKGMEVQFQTKSSKNGMMIKISSYE